MYIPLPISPKLQGSCPKVSAHREGYLSFGQNLGCLWPPCRRIPSITADHAGTMEGLFAFLPEDIKEHFYLLSSFSCKGHMLDLKERIPTN